MLLRISFAMRSVLWRALHLLDLHLRVLTRDMHIMKVRWLNQCSAIEQQAGSV